MIIVRWGAERGGPGLGPKHTRTWIAIGAAAALNLPVLGCGGADSSPSPPAGPAGTLPAAPGFEPTSEATSTSIRFAWPHQRRRSVGEAPAAAVCGAPSQPSAGPRGDLLAVA